MKENNPGQAGGDPGYHQQGISYRVINGYIIQGIGVFIIAYGALAFFVFHGLPPNGGQQGRLPCIYLMGFGVVVFFIGAVLSSFSNKGARNADKPRGVPAGVGITIILLIVIAFILAITML